MRSLGGGRQQIGELDKRMGGKKRGRKREENKKKERERGTLGHTADRDRLGHAGLPTYIMLRVLYYVRSSGQWVRGRREEQDDIK